MSNRVFLTNDGIIGVEVIGDQNLASVDLMGHEINALLTQIKALGKPGLVLDDVTQMGVVEPDARKMVVELGKRLDYDRTAMLGNGGLLRFGANLMLRATGRGDAIRYFTDRDEAIAWLKDFAPDAQK